jgi:protein-ribulosamine 3-kinase
MVPQAVLEWLLEKEYGALQSSQPVSGGCINHGMRLFTAAGSTFFLKVNSSLPPDVFRLEAEGLAALRKAGGPRLPQPLLHGPDFLLLEDLTPAPRQPDFWPVLGEQLAVLHHHTSSRFGFAHDNYLGATAQPNPWVEDGHEFFAEHRLMFQARLAQRRGYFQNEELRLAERMCRRLPELAPSQPAALIHGDLWSGNVISDRAGRPAVIDPAAYYGWAEAELGMTALFGGFPESFYRAYELAHPLAPGWRKRLEIYNLYHLLNHLNLFGRGYYGEVVAILRRYGG